MTSKKVVSPVKGFESSQKNKEAKNMVSFTTIKS